MVTSLDKNTQDEDKDGVHAANGNPHTSPGYVKRDVEGNEDSIDNDEQSFDGCQSQVDTHAEKTKIDDTVTKPSSYKSYTKTTTSEVKITR